MRTTPPRLLLAPLLALAGCAYRAVGPVPPGLDEQRYAALRTVAARDLRCPEDELAHAAIGDGRHLFAGCGGEVVMLLLEGADAEAYGFPRGFIEPAPTNLFSQEFACGPRDTREIRIDARTRVVEGCGRSAAYDNLCNEQGACRPGPSYWSACVHCAWTARPAQSAP